MACKIKIDSTHQELALKWHCEREKQQNPIKIQSINSSSSSKKERKKKK
jgi:hypothetical protein